MPEAFENLEKAVLNGPNGAERVQKTREWMKQILEQMARAQSAAA